MNDSLELEHIRVDRDGPVTRVTLARPKVHNAFGSRMIEELGSVFTDLSTDDQTRVIVLGGEGKSFSAGADINWMRESVGFSRQQNVDDATRLALMLESISRCDKPVVCRVQGLAIGGGLGLISAADYVVAEENAEFAFSEVKLGLVPAVISPFVLRRIGPGHARALFITGERFKTERALCIGLVHVSVPSAKLDAEVDRVVDELLTAAPDGVTISKHLVEDVSYRTSREMQLHTAETIASKRTDPEGQEGLTAFLEKRRPTLDGRRSRTSMARIDAQRRPMTAAGSEGAASATGNDMGIGVGVGGGVTRVLIANRGEIAIRIMRACHELDIETVAVYSDADRTAPHVRAASCGAVHIGPTPARESYLSVERIIAAAVESGADAVHPGYGFLSEQADFADACIAAGLTFIGPSRRCNACVG